MTPVCIALDNKSLSSAAKEIIMASWRPGTGKQYNSFLGRWEKFCAQKAILVEEARNSQNRAAGQTHRHLQNITVSLL